jgi:hypothetical protein
MNYPNCPLVARSVRIGGVSKRELLETLLSRGIALNEYARMLFADPRFATAAESSVVDTVEITVANLGLTDGGTSGEIHGRMADVGLAICPMELGPHLRLQFLDQPEGQVGHAASQHRAPAGSVTVASGELSENAHAGFYLRRIDGVLWLRGYRYEPDHLWSPEDRMVFARRSGVA